MTRRKGLVLDANILLRGLERVKEEVRDTRTEVED